MTAQRLFSVVVSFHIDNPYIAVFWPSPTDSYEARHYMAAPYTRHAKKVHHSSAAPH